MLHSVATLRAIPRRLFENYGTALVARLQSDVSAASRLHHPGIVGVFEYGEESDWVFIAMEFVEGSCLKAKSRISVADAVSLINTISTKHSQEGDQVYMRTSFPVLVHGRIVVEMYPEVAPNHVARIKQLSRAGFSSRDVSAPRQRRWHGHRRRFGR
jgi:serine/threonine protein kinase